MAGSVRLANRMVVQGVEGVNHPSRGLSLAAAPTGHTDASGGRHSLREKLDARDLGVVPSPRVCTARTGALMGCAGMTGDGAGP